MLARDKRYSLNGGSIHVEDNKFYFIGTSGLYNKNMTIVNDAKSWSFTLVSSTTFLKSSIMLLESSIMLLENIKNTGFICNCGYDCYLQL